MFFIGINESSIGNCAQPIGFGKQITTSMLYDRNTTTAYIKELLIKIDRNNKHLKQLKKFTFEQISKLLSDKNFRSVIIFADVDAG